MSLVTFVGEMIKCTTFLVRHWFFVLVVERASSEDEIRVQSQSSDPVGMIF